MGGGWGGGCRRGDGRADSVITCPGSFLAAFLDEFACIPGAAREVEFGMGSETALRATCAEQADSPSPVGPGLADRRPKAGQRTQGPDDRGDWVVIFDTVIDEPHWRANLFIPSLNEEICRLLNVAITRAQSRLVMVGDFPYIHMHAKHAVLNDLLQAAENVGSTVDALDRLVSPHERRERRHSPRVRSRRILTPTGW